MGATPRSHSYPFRPPAEPASAPLPPETDTSTNIAAILSRGSAWLANFLPRVEDGVLHANVSGLWALYLLASFVLSSSDIITSWIFLPYRLTLGLILTSVAGTLARILHLLGAAGPSAASSISSAALASAIGLAVGILLGLRRRRAEAAHSLRSAAMRLRPSTAYVRTLLGRRAAAVPYYLRDAFAPGESCAWLDALVSEAFPTLNQSLPFLVEDLLGPVFNSNKPAGVRSIRMVKVDLGTQVPSFTDAQTITLDDQNLAIDFGERRDDPHPAFMLP